MRETETETKTETAREREREREKGVVTIGMTTSVGASTIMITTVTDVATMTDATESREKACACGHDLKKICLVARWRYVGG